MDSKHAEENKGPDVDKIDDSSPKERLDTQRDSSSSSSSVQSSDFEDPFQGEESALKSPPTQTMERPPESSAHRIPSHVFARNKSGNPGEWSINSTESLFSIQMGTTSFTHDQFSWLMKSGELNAEGYNKNLDPSENSDPHHPISENSDSSGDQTSSDEPTELPLEKTNTEKSADVNTTEIASTNNEPATVNEEGPETKPAAGHRKGESEIDADRNSNTNTKSSTEEHRQSTRGSNASAQSFAFPLLAGDFDGGHGEKSGTTPQVKSQEKTQPQPNTDQVQAETTEAAQPSSWFSRCVSFCSCR